jgi:hypothetical protein
MKTRDSMSQASRRTAAAPIIGETFQDEPTSDAGLPPPLDEIARRPRSGPDVSSRATRKRRSSGFKASEGWERRRRKKPRSPATLIAPGELIVGTIVGFTDSGEPLVEPPWNHDSEPPLPARSTVPLRPSQVGRQVVLGFEWSGVGKPIILGVLWEAAAHAQGPLPRQCDPVRADFAAIVDKERLVLTADKEIVLRCGEASITLTRAGKVLLRGTYLLSRSSGVNRIKGGSVQIN